MAKVLEVGESTDDVKITVAIGDTVIFSQYAGTVIKANDAKHDIGEVQYGDTPLIHYDEKEYEHFHTLTGTMANLEAVKAYIYSQNGTYDLYRTLIGEVYISENGTVLCGDISVKYRGKTYDIMLNEMYGLHSLTILRLGDKVKGFREDGQGFRREPQDPERDYGRD